MASSVQETGYEDELFQYPVGPSFHCCICTNVIKDPVMCHNEHIFCRACITTHLMYSQTCPTCMQPLTVETLRQAPRGIKNLLSELQIRCEFFDRGCGKFVQLGDLERHVADCGFAPAVCSNEGCQLVVNKQDLLHHETAVCELRRVKCHSCNDIRREMDTLKVKLTAIDEKLDNNAKDFKMIEETMKNNAENVKEIKAVQIELVQKLSKQEESSRQLRADNVIMKESLNGIIKQLEIIAQVQAEQMNKGIAEGGGMEREPKIVVAGGGGLLNSVEMFSLATKTWTPLQPMKECRAESSSVVWNNQIVVSGGKDKSIEKLSLNAVQVDLSTHWEKISAELPARLSGHRSVVYNGQMIVIGGFDRDTLAYSDSIKEISLVPPYTGKMLANMPEGRYQHGVAIFGDKILIVGGKRDRDRPVLRSVIMYDITKNQFHQLAPLPYPVYGMATVKWDDDNVMIMGGADSNGQRLNKVLMYNIKTQKSHELPNMKYKKSGCVAAVVRDTVIVMGGNCHEDS